MSGRNTNQRVGAYERRAASITTTITISSAAAVRLHGEALRLGLSDMQLAAEIIETVMSDGLIKAVLDR